jgi:hypothetical protein
MRQSIISLLQVAGLSILLITGCRNKSHESDSSAEPDFRLIRSDTMFFNSFVDCNMAEAWIGDTFRIFPGKYGEDPLWGDARDLKFADGRNSMEAFSSPASAFRSPQMPENASPGASGLHGAVWFETIYQDETDASGKTLFAVYHNENYPSTFPFDEATGEGYKSEKWPQGLKGPGSPAAVCRIGIMKSVNGGRSWENKGIFIEDLQPRLILKPHNTSNTFAGGVGDPSAVRSGDYLYLFYGEYGYPGIYDADSWNAEMEAGGQCISVARIDLKDLDNPAGKAKRWDGKTFSAPFDGTGSPIESLRIPLSEGGGPVSSPKGSYHWGPSVSWNTWLNCWVMLMGQVTGPSWAGSRIYISFNTNRDLGINKNSQEWSKPRLLLDKPGYFLWYPSLQPLNTPEDITGRYTCLRLGQKARLFVKYLHSGDDKYMSEYVIEFSKKERNNQKNQL